MTSDRDREGFSPEEELVPEDDAVIGRAFRWSLLVIGIIAGAVAASLFISGDTVPDEEVRAVDAEAPQQLIQEAEGRPLVRFSDITREAGIDFRHVSGAMGDKLLPETMGGGGAFLDYDNDGDQDLLLVNSDYWPQDRRRGSDRPTMAFYENDGTGSFKNRTSEVGLDVSFYGMGVAAGDYDGDGAVDLYITAVGPNRLYRNVGGRFQEVTQEAGVAGDASDWGTSAGFFDYDNDGDLDLLVCNYVKWSREIDFELNFTLNGVDRAYGPPNNFTGSYPYLFRNEGKGKFQDVSKSAGIQVDNPSTGQPLGKSLGLLPIDLDRDGFIDVIVANDTVQNFLFHNQGDGTFLEIGMESGLAFDFNGKATGAMGIDAGYFREDDTVGVGIGNFANEMTSLYLSQEDPLWFADESISQGVGSPSRLNLTFGLFLFDYDLDSRLDLLQANGHLEEEISQVQASQQYHQPAQLFWNAGSAGESNFVEVPQDQVGDLSRPIVGRGATYADIDGDGDLDVLLLQAGGAPLLLQNQQQLGHNWVRLKLVGKKGNPDAIGAWVYLTIDGRTQRRQVMPTRSYLSQVELPVTLGLGAYQEFDSLRILWPDGSSQQLEKLPLNRLSVIRQPH